MLNNNKFSFTAKADTGILNLSLYGPIGADMLGDGITAAGVTDALNATPEFTSVTVHINSPGGDLFEGTSIYNSLRSLGKPVNVVIDGLAASAASLIACAGDTITMNPGSTYMLHEAQAVTMGYASDMRKMADVLDTVTDSAADIYVTKTGIAKDKVLAYMKAETWFTPQEAIDAGFATAISKDKAKVTNAFDLSVFKNTPDSLKAQAEVTEPVVVVEPDPIIDILKKRIAIARRK